MITSEYVYDRCALCPRACGADRRRGAKGFCGETASIRAACALLHFGEEPPISGEGGSGTVFFSGCTLRCAYCQNWQLSRGEAGGVLSRDELAGIFLRLQAAGAENVNIVTGTQFAPGIVEAFEYAGTRGLSIPLVWNSSGYESTDTMAFLAPRVRFFLPDLKTLDPRLSAHWLNAADYPERATRAVRAMADAIPLVREGDVPVQGVIVRHLVLPGKLQDTRNVLSWFAANLNGRAMLSLMFQFTPIPGLKLPPPLDRMVDSREYEEACGMLEEFQIEGYCQDPETDGEWLPDFTRSRPFPSGNSRVIWHYMDGVRPSGVRLEE